MITIICDICEQRIVSTHDVIKLSVAAGEHPHSGTKLSREIDCCKECITQVEVSTSLDLESLRRKLRKS